MQTQRSHTPGRCRLFQLPLEIRDMIYANLEFQFFTAGYRYPRKNRRLPQFQPAANFRCFSNLNSACPELRPDLKRLVRKNPDFRTAILTKSTCSTRYLKQNTTLYLLDHPTWVGYHKYRNMLSRYARVVRYGDMDQFEYTFGRGLRFFWAQASNDGVDSLLYKLTRVRFPPVRNPLQSMRRLEIVLPTKFFRPDRICQILDDAGLIVQGIGRRRYGLYPRLEEVALVYESGTVACVLPVTTLWKSTRMGVRRFVLRKHRLWRPPLRTVRKYETAYASSIRTAVLRTDNRLFGLEVSLQPRRSGRVSGE